MCISILPFLLKYMYQARKVISVCIDLALFIDVYVPIQEMISVYIGLALFIGVHVPSQESDQCVYRSCPFY